MNSIVEKLNGNAGFLGNIATIVTIIATVLCGTLWMNNKIASVGEHVVALRADMVEQIHAVDKRLIINESALKLLPSQDRWRGQDMIVWSLKLKDENSDMGLAVPDPASILRDRRHNE
jgi:hypothetical protein